MMTEEAMNETQREDDVARKRREFRDAEMSQPDARISDSSKWTPEQVAKMREQLTTPGFVVEVNAIDDFPKKINPHLMPASVDVQPARDILGCGMKELADRERTYDAPGGERSMAKAVAAFNAIHGLGMTEVQGWQFMELLKIVRSSQGAFKLDNFVDGAAYAALAGEAASRAS